MLPSAYLNLPRLEKAFVIAAIQVKIEADKKREKETRRKANKGGRRKRR